MRIGINGFGRIGRNFTKALVERHPEIEIAAVNDLTERQECAHLFKYDSNYGIYAGNVGAGDGTLTIDRQRIRVFAERDPGKLPWKDLGVDVVVESTGLFTDAAKARAHIDSGGAKKVIISAPAKGEDITIVLGVNEAATIRRSTTSSPTPPARRTAWPPPSNRSSTSSAGSKAS